MSPLVTEPNRRPSTPAFWVSLTVCAGELLALGLRFRPAWRRSLFEFDALGFEFGLVGFGGAAGAAVRDQEVAGVAVLDLDDLAQVAEVDDFLEQDDLHGSLLRCGAGRCTAPGPGSARA
jgi:hypothetical protein